MERKEAGTEEARVRGGKVTRHGEEGRERREKGRGDSGHGTGVPCSGRRRREGEVKGREGMKGRREELVRWESRLKKVTFARGFGKTKSCQKIVINKFFPNRGCASIGFS